MYWSFEIWWLFLKLWRCVYGKDYRRSQYDSALMGAPWVHTNTSPSRIDSGLKCVGITSGPVSCLDTSITDWEGWYRSSVVGPVSLMVYTDVRSEQSRVLDYSDYVFECLFSLFVVCIVSSLSKYSKSVDHLFRIWKDWSSGSVFTD